MDDKVVRVLLVEDDPGDARLLREMLLEAGENFQLTHVDRLAAALEHLAQADPDVVLLDLSVQDSDGLDTFLRAYAVAPAVPFVVMTGLSDESMAVNAMRQGAQDYLVKGQVDSSLLGRSIRYAIERKKVEEALRASEERFRLVVEHAGDAFFLHDLEGKIVQVNQQACDILGYTRERLQAMSLGDVEVGFSQEKLSDAIGKIGDGAPVTLETVHLRSDGSSFPVEVRLGRFDSPGGPLFLALARDISQRRSLEQQLLQSQKLEAVGQLAGGIAHDFNNLTTPIISYAQLGLSLVPPTDRLHGYLLEIRKAGERAAQLTNQLLAFSRSQVIEPQIEDLNQLILNVDRMVRRILGENIELVFLPGEDLGLINVDPAQMEQVVMNLVVNARDAMPGGGRIKISTDDVVLDDDYARTHPLVAAGEYVMLTVNDTGVGITDEVKEHIFEPFFTTKEVGQGTGLGLSTCFGIVAQMGGHITVDSEPGNGATFSVYMPRATGHCPDEGPEEREENAAGGSETVMIVEDEVAVLKVASEILRRHGYTVLEASNGHEAIWLAQERANERIDLLVTDVVMPLMGGPQLATQMADLHPETSVLYTSGYPGDHILDEGLQSQAVRFLPKPYNQDSLTFKVRQALES